MKPKVSTANWHSVFADDEVRVYQDGNDYMFYKVIIRESRPKYFYGETAHSDVSRYCADEVDIGYWSVLDYNFRSSH